MIGWLQRRRARAQAGKAWHQAILAKVREPGLYARGVVADTFDGRFHMLTLVCALVLRQLREDGPEGFALADRVYREVFSGLDHAMREEGVSDSSIARKMRARGEAFFGLARAIDTAMAPSAGAAELAEVLIRNHVTDHACAKELAEWLRALAAGLAVLPQQARFAGQPGWMNV